MLANHLEISIDEFEQKFVRQIGVRKSLIEFENGDCVFFDNAKRKCTVYEARPKQCRTWPFWESNLQTPASWKETCERCPGCGHGDLVPLEEITRQAEVVKV